MAAVSSASWPRRARPLAPLAPIAAAVAGLAAVSAATNPPLGILNSYAGLSWTARAADLAAGLGLLVAGAAALSHRMTSRMGLLATFAGVAWIAQDVEGWVGAPGWVRSIGGAAVPLFGATLAALVLGGQSGSIQPRSVAYVFRALATVVVAAALFRALVRDPLVAQSCWRDCVDHAFLVRSAPRLAQTLDDVWLSTTAALGVLACAAAVERLWRGTATARWLLAPLLVPGALAAATQAVYAVALLRDPAEDPRNPTFATLFYARSLTVAALAAGVLLAALAVRGRGAAVARLAAELGEAPPPGRLRESLASAFGDAALQVGYWLPRLGRYVDAAGNGVDIAPDRAATRIVRDGRPVAVVVHDASLLGGTFEQELGSAARLAVDNERLQAQVHAQLTALRESRARVIERGDAERRRLERNLHDGAQQSLLALSFDLRLARAAADADGDTALAARLAGAAAEAQAALEELRDLAHGIFPAVLAEGGLAAAIETLADEARLPVEIEELPSARYALPAEAAVYVAIREALDDAVARGATFAALGVRESAERLELVVSDDGTAREPLQHVSDRVGALGGDVTFEANAMRATVPCV